MIQITKRNYCYANVMNIILRQTYNLDANNRAMVTHRFIANRKTHGNFVMEYRKNIGAR